MARHDVGQWNDIGPAEIFFGLTGTSPIVPVSLGKTATNPDGGTHGGARWRLTIEARDSFRDASGVNRHDRTIVGRSHELEVALTGTSLVQLASLIPGARLTTGPTTKKLIFGNPTGLSERDNAQQLLIKPIIAGVTSTDEEDWMDFPLAFPEPDFEVPFSVEDQKVFTVRFMIFDLLTASGSYSAGDIGGVGFNAA